MLSAWNVSIIIFSRYCEQAARDTDVVYRRVQQLLHQLNQPADTISESEVKQFCKHASCLHVIRGTKIAEEYLPKSANAALIGKLMNRIFLRCDYYFCTLWEYT